MPPGLLCLQVLVQLKQVRGLTELRGLAGKLHRGCAALRASLEQHVRAEEQELWPLFAENFSTAEQERLIGVIIGRTGAEVLQSLLPWVTGELRDIPRA
jgi:zinc finger-like protein